ncbi:MAG TPA: c-type cytochrome [Bryobacteraceae bacterium]|jgi:mono/diheme cytochrome c family protein|nr:c-type cytochrome [Bryobacteraceae bacterium]
MSRGRLAVLCVLFGFVLAISAGYWIISSHGFSAREQPSRVEALLARNVRRLATPANAKALQNPVSRTELAIAEARDHFADHCAICHGNDGSGRTQINAGLYPPAPDMGQWETQQLSDGELFYIIRNGVRFTGMPGWGGEDEENWKLVLFIRHLPKLSDKELELMKEINGIDTDSTSRSRGDRPTSQSPPNERTKR